MAPSDGRASSRSWGKRVERRRLHLGLSQEALGTLAGLPQQTVSRVELNLVVPRYRTMAALAGALGTSIELLFPMDAYPDRLKTTRRSAI
jgi:transcriptional regulator with XRE-family HTH domain